MALSLAASAENTTKSVQLTASGVPGGTTQLTYTLTYPDFPDAGGYTVDTAAGVTTTVHDYPTYNHNLRYTVTAYDSGGASLGTATADSILVYSGITLSSRDVNPGQWWDMQVVADDPHQLQARGAWHTVIGRTTPLAQFAPMLLHSGSLTARIPDVETHEDMLNLFEPGWPLRLRSGTRKCWSVLLLPQSVSFSHVVEGNEVRMMQVQYQTLGRYPRPADPYEF